MIAQRLLIAMLMTEGGRMSRAIMDYCALAIYSDREASCKGYTSSCSGRPLISLES
jgi:hypothetical protein